MMVKSTEVIASDIKGDMTCAEYGRSLIVPKRPVLLRRLLKAMRHDRT